MSSSVSGGVVQEQQQLLDSSRNLLGQLTGQCQYATQLHQQRLPNGSIIRTLNKPGPAPTILLSVTSSSRHLSNFNLQTNEAATANLLEAATANQLASKSKHHVNHHKTTGRIVIVQKDVKPVMYHLLRAYLKLCRLLRLSDATYVNPIEASRAARWNQARR